MTPQEITDYKIKWMQDGGYAVPFGSDKKFDANRFCRQHFGQHEFKLTTYTDVYEHTMWFEKEEDAELFKNNIK